MSVLGLIGPAISIGSSIAGGISDFNSRKAVPEFTEKVLNQRIYEDQQARMQPYVDFGKTGANMLSEGFDFRDSPEYAYRQQLGSESLQGLGGFDPSVLQYAGSRMGAGIDATEQDDAYSKIIDRVKIGQGQAASAGQGAQQYGNALATAYQRAGEGQRLASMGQQNAQQAGVNTVLGQMSGIPAYMQQQNYLQGLNTSGGGNSGGGYLGSADQYTGGMNYFR